MTTSTQRSEDHHGPHRDGDQIRINVDGEDYTTHLDHMTPNEIIRKFAKLDPATHYLVQILGHNKKTSYEGTGDIPIKLHSGMRFQAICTGPTPVSDGRP